LKERKMEERKERHDKFLQDSKNKVSPDQLLKQMEKEFEKKRDEFIAEHRARLEKENVELMAEAESLKLKLAQLKAMKKAANAPASDPKADAMVFGRLNILVGRIIEIHKHPDAAEQYVEQVDFGEAKPRIVVSGLVRFTPMEEMQNKLAIFLCNAKPIKIRGVESQAMILCACPTPLTMLEILDPPAGSQPGDRVVCPQYAGTPDKVISSKSLVWEKVAPELKVSESGEATYRGERLFVEGKGTVTAPSLRNVLIY